MKAKADRIKELSDAFAALLNRERQTLGQMVHSLTESVRAIQGNTADRRLQRLAAQLKALHERIDLLIEMGRADYLAKISREADHLTENLSDSRTTSVLTALTQIQTSSLNRFCETLLDLLIEATGAERGFILFYLPESTEADLVAARNFQTKNLSLEEFSFSRTVLGEVLRRGRSLLIEDALNDPNYSREASVIELALKSVLAIPLKQDERTIGALYLENNTQPCAFDRQDQQLVESLAQFAVFYLRHARLLPALFERERRVFLDTSQAPREIIGQDLKIIAALEVINRIADSPAAVLIEGESGTGKELVARALHYQSARRERPFIAINCAAIPENLLESELFGYEKGAFTGAVEKRIGRIEQGDGGTIFLDEISELAYGLQAKLLRFLQSNEFDRLGGKQPVKVNVRVVTATSKDLKSLVAAGKFQDALYYRLNVIPLRLPPLRERKDDIPLLAEHFLNKLSSIYGRKMSIESGVFEALKEHPFPGNVRELENLIHRLIVLASDEIIRVGDLPREIFQITSKRVSLMKDSLHRMFETDPADLEELRQRREETRRLLTGQRQRLIERAIKDAGGNLTEAAARLGINRTTLHKMLKKNEKG